MPQPTLGQVHVNQPLTNISVAYIQTQQQFVSTKVFPLVPVDKASDVYYSYTKADWFRDEAQKRAPSSESAGSGYGLTTGNYTCDVYAVHKDIPDQILNNADSMLNLDRDATLFVTQRILLRQEIQWAADYFTTSVWGTDVTGAATSGVNQAVYWSDYSNSDPIGDVRTGIATVLQNTGFEPNKLVLGYQTYLKLIDHPDIVARVQGGSTTTTPALVNPDMLARIFGVDEVIICKSIKNTANEGATAVFSFVQGKGALLVYVPSNAGLLTPAAGYTFFWRGVSQGLGQSIGVTRFRMEWLKSTRVEGEVAFTNKVIGSDLGYFFNGIVQ